MHHGGRWLGWGSRFRQPGKGLVGEQWAATRYCWAVMGWPPGWEEGRGCLLVPGVPVTENWVPFARVWPSILPPWGPRCPSHQLIPSAGLTSRPRRKAALSLRCHCGTDWVGCACPCPWVARNLNAMKCLRGTFQFPQRDKRHPLDVLPSWPCRVGCPCSVLLRFPGK